jgi:hypothetical protein
MDRNFMKYSTVKISFGMCENNALVHISEVKTSDTRTFKCLSCGTNLIPVIDDGLTDSFCIIAIIFVCFNKWFNKLRTY